MPWKAKILILIGVLFAFMVPQSASKGAIDCSVFLTKGYLVNKLDDCGVNMNLWYNATGINYFTLCQGQCVRDLLSNISAFINNCQIDIESKPDTVGQYYRKITFWDATIRSMCVVFSGSYCMPSMMTKIYKNNDLRQLINDFENHDLQSLFQLYFNVVQNAPLIADKPDYCLPCNQKMLGQLFAWQSRNTYSWYPEFNDNINHLASRISGLCGASFVSIAQTVYAVSVASLPMVPFWSPLLTTLLFLMYYFWM